VNVLYDMSNWCANFQTKGQSHQSHWARTSKIAEKWRVSCRLTGHLCSTVGGYTDAQWH